MKSGEIAGQARNDMKSGEIAGQARNDMKSGEIADQVTKSSFIRQLLFLNTFNL